MILPIDAAILSLSQSPCIILDKHMDREGLEIVLDNGLWERCGDLHKEWHAHLTKAASNRDDDKKKEMRKHKNLSSAKSLQSGMLFWLAKQASIIYRCAASTYVNETFD